MSNHDEVALPTTCKEMNRSVTGRDAAMAFLEVATRRAFSSSAFGGDVGYMSSICDITGRGSV